MGEEEKAVASKNAVTIEDAGPCRKKVIIEIPEETIKTVTDEQYEQLRKEAIVPGFRRGRAPRRLLEKRFGKETSEQIKLKLIAEASESALKDNQVQTISEPDIDFENVELPAEGPLKFDFEVDVKPEFELPELEGIPVTRRKLQVSDEEINREIERIQRLSGIWTPRENEPVQLNDQVIAEVAIKAEDSEDYERLGEVEIYVRHNGFVSAIPVEQLDELLAGSKVGDKKQTTVDVPKTYFKEEYRGKKVDISIEIKDIKWLKPADLDQDLLNRLGVENTDELRERIRDRLQDELEQRTRKEMEDQIYQYLLENTHFELPLEIVGEHASTLLQRLYVNLLVRGLSSEQINQQMEQLRASSEEQARDQLRKLFIMDKVADELDVELTDEEVNGRIAELALHQGQRPERMREEMARNGSLEQFRVELRHSKCIAKLLESAKITEVEPEKKTKKPKKSTSKKAKSSKPTDKKQPKKCKKAAENEPEG